jgi:hypothetical protein
MEGLVDTGVESAKEVVKGMVEDAKEVVVAEAKWKMKL